MKNLPRLSEKLLNTKFESAADFPDREQMGLPEKAIVFGTGAFLRGFVGFFLDKANKKGLFNGRAVVIQSSKSRRAEILNEQDGLFTLCEQGLEDEKPVQRYSVISSYSRCLAAPFHWKQILELARSPQIEIVFSNTTDVGLSLGEKDLHDDLPPDAFPSKLTRMLKERFDHLGKKKSPGWIIMPCELVQENGRILRELVTQTAINWAYPAEFMEWLDESNTFCSTLVDRIVPGAPETSDYERAESVIGYHDSLLTSAEIYRMFAIQGEEQLADKLDFASADDGIVISGDISPYWERKIRLLNAVHTIMVPKMFMDGKETVLEVMEDADSRRFVWDLMTREIIPVLSIPKEMALSFAEDVIQRFSNPYLHHQLIQILFQSVTKWRRRVLPLVLANSEKERAVQKKIVQGFAALLHFLRSTRCQDDMHYFGTLKNREYPITVDQQSWFSAQWHQLGEGSSSSKHNLLKSFCGKEEFWGANLNDIPGFFEALEPEFNALFGKHPKA